MPKKLDQMQKAVKKALKKQFPKMPEKELDSKAWAIAKDRLAKMDGENMETEIKEDIKLREEIKYDEKGREIIAENCPIIFEAEINSIEEDNNE